MLPSRRPFFTSTDLKIIHDVSLLPIDETSIVSQITLQLDQNIINRAINCNKLFCNIFRQHIESIDTGIEGTVNSRWSLPPQKQQAH